MHSDNENGLCTFRALSVSDPCLSNTHEIAPFNSHYAEDTIDRSTSDAKVMYSREPKKTRDTTIRDTTEPPKPRVLKLVLKEPKKLPPPEDEGTDIDEEYYCYHKYYKGIIPLRDYYTYRPTPPAGKSSTEPTIKDGPSSSKTGPHGPQPSASSSTRPTDKALLDHVIKLSKTDEGTDIDKAYYLYHQYYNGTMPPSDSYPHRPPSPDGNSSSPKASADASSACQIGLNRPGSSASSRARPTDKVLLDHVIELSKTDEGTDIDKAYYLYHQFYKGTMPSLPDSYTHRPPPPDGGSSSPKASADAPSAGQTGLNRPRQSASNARPTDKTLLDRVIELSQTDEGTDLDQAYYRYHKCYKGVIPLSDYYTCRLSRTNGNGPLRQTTTYVPAAQTGLHDMQPLEQALLSAQVLLNDSDYSA